MFGRDKSGVATIVSRRVKSATSTGGPIYEFVADVKVEGELEMYRCVMQEPNMTLSFKAPSEGAQVKVHANPKRESAKFDMSDPSLSLKTQRESEDAAFEAAKLGAPGEGGYSAEEEVDPATGPTDSQLQRAWEAVNAHNRKLPDVKASGDKARIDEWLATSTALNESLRRMRFQRQDWEPTPMPGAPGAR